jgi:alpha-beta hydrolase superfamily lysophospholipase
MEALPRTLLALLTTLTLLPLAACGGGDEAPPPEPTSRAAGAPEPAERCGMQGDAKKLVLTTSDGVELAAAEFGSGARGLVLVHQRGSDLCGWWSYARTWADGGYHVLAMDLRCSGFSECPESKDYIADTTAAVKALRDAGASKVVLIGASMGGSTVLAAGGRLGDQVDGVVSLSANSTTVDGGGEVGVFKAPLLMVYAKLDASTMRAADAQAFVSAAQTTEKELLAVEGTGHGWALLQDGDIVARVNTFLGAHA